MTKMTKSAVAAADGKALRAFASDRNVKYIGKKQEDLRAELMAMAEDDKVKKEKGAAKSAAKPAEKAPAAKKEPAPKKERVSVSAADLAEIETMTTKKAKVITLRERKYSIHAIAEAVDLHPTNVSRYIRDAGLSTSTIVVPQERRDRIKASIALRKASAPAASASVAAPAAPAAAAPTASAVPTAEEPAEEQAPAQAQAEAPVEEAAATGAEDAQ